MSDTPASRLSRLSALASTLEESIAVVDADKRAPLAAQLRATLAEIDELAGAPESSKPAANPLDELANRRKSRPSA